MVSAMDGPSDADQMPATLEKSFHLVLASTRVLYVNGAATRQVVDEADRLGHALGVRATVMARWGELQLKVEDRSARFTAQAAAIPTGVDMDRVAAVTGVIDDIEAGRLAPDAAAKAVGAIALRPPSPAWLFTLAAAAGAVALSVIFGIADLAPAVLIFLSAGLGAVLRRGLARLSTNIFIQPFCAALLAGVIGALAIRYEPGPALWLVAVCPCMVLVPGPHILNGALDLAHGRIDLGSARLVYAGLVVLAISIGLLAGLALFGVSLPIDPPGLAVPWWQDVIAAGVAVAAYSVFYSTPLTMLPWPVAVGMLAHGIRWVALTVLGVGVAGGALVAAVVASLILYPISRRRHMPFAAIGFAAVVSMMPGVYLFRMASALVQIGHGSKATDLLSGVAANGAIATMVILALSLGLIIPKMLIDYLSHRSGKAD